MNADWLDDRQEQDVGDEDPNYARSFGTPEAKEESLGFKDQREIRTSPFQRLKIWVHRHLYRPWK